MKSSAPHLTGILGEIAEATSVGVALTIAHEWGGTRRKFPSRPRAGCKLAKLVGLEAAEAIINAIGGGEHTVPMGPQKGRAGRTAQVVRLLKDGLSHSEVVRRADVHQRTVERHSSTIKKPLPLFKDV